VRAAILIALVLFASVACHENANVKRARELLSVDEVPGAITELKIAVKADPENKAARGLLLYALLKQDKSLTSVFEAQPAFQLLADGAWPAGVAQESKDALVESTKNVRRVLYNLGLDTKDAADLAALLVDAARAAVDDSKDDAEIDAASMVLAMRGDPKAVARLVDRLKSEQALAVPEYLERIGSPAATALTPAAKNAEDLGHTKALGVLGKVLAVDLARGMFNESATLRGIDVTDLPEAVRTREVSSLLAQEFVDGLTRELALKGVKVPSANAKLRLHSVYAGDDKWEKGMLLLEGWDATPGKAINRFFLFENGAYRALQVVRAGAPADTTFAIARIRLNSAGRVEIARPEVTSVEQEREVAHETFATGDRVSIRNIAVKGTVTATDDLGLVHVHLDQEVRGLHDLQTSPLLLRALEKVSVEKPGFVLVTGRLVAPDRVELDGAPRSVEHLPPMDAAIDAQR
jgi:hypothetical protein